ncbi:NADH-quinone oxidoreductase subunit C [Myxococcota bacterium]|nr:NADH-quinone oxidoreductase subunit C [Myxococcota bacterium]MCZ7619550.1 NADH-quinone oxidoreductase subunit C [Myxococcota bacterium]
MDDFGASALRRLLEAKREAVLATHATHGDATAWVEAAQVVDVLRLLRDDPACRFDMLVDLCAVDYLRHPDHEGPRFEVVYHLLSTTLLQRVRIKAGVPELPCQIDSCVEVWPAANWMEREVFDLYGIRFRNHPDLRRILLYEEFEGHPLRKDYPKERRQPLIGPRN